MESIMSLFKTGKDRLALRWKLAYASALLMVAPTAFAGTITSTDTFYNFFQTVQQWSQGALAAGIAIASILFGAFVAVGTNKPVLALVGLVLAAIIKFAPSVAIALVTSGAVLH